MYAGFNGEYRRKPVVSIRGVGASKKETKEDLVRRLKEERAEREVSQCQINLCQILGQIKDSKLCQIDVSPNPL